MRLPIGLLAVLLSSELLRVSAKFARRTYDTHDYYVIRHSPTHGHSPAECAEAIGTELIEQVGELENYWLVRTPKSQLISSEDSVVASWKALRRRSSTPISQSIRSLLPQKPRTRVKRQLSPAPSDDHTQLDRVIAEMDIHDPQFKDQWHIINVEYPEHMMNVTGVWKDGITGKGVTSAMVDDGIDYENPDLAPNFDEKGSYDFNDHQPLPKPKLWDDTHGTRCAGEIAAAKNDVCGLGLAYESKVAGIRILSGPISDADEAAALNYGYQDTSIYSCSWGPPDSGRDMEGPGVLIQRAVINGINKGRGGKGSIFVFASGNGAGSGDACNFDGYTNSIYSVTVGAVDYKGMHPYYSEACAANMIVTYSSGAGKHIVTSNVGPTQCSSQHGGTSAAAPLAVGVFALALEVRPDLTWRDIQHLCVRSGVQINPTDPDWETTAAGRPYSYKYGYGKLDGYGFVAMARNWQLVKPQAWLELPTIELKDAAMINDTMTGGEFIVPGGVKSVTKITQADLDKSNFEKLEHITIKVWVTHGKRGDVEIELISPTGVKSILASVRKFDDDPNGFIGWQFMTLKHWDENPIGEWTLRVADQGNQNHNGSFLGWSMTLWGSALDSSKATKFEIPESMSDEDEQRLPPHATATQVQEQTKVLPKPTLPPDHAIADGETTRSAFQQSDEKSETSSSSSTSMPDAADEGIFTHMYDLLSNQIWLVVAGSIVLLFAIGSGVFFYMRKKRLRLRGHSYEPLSVGDEMRMGALERGSNVGRTRELYDAFEVHSDEDDDDVNEASALAPGGGYEGDRGGLSYHDGFLDDDGPPSARSGDARYRDDPEHPSHTVPDAKDSPRVGSDGSGDGSWQDAAEGATLR